MNIDFLRKNCVADPVIHGLGIIKLYMKGGYHYNFHSKIINNPSKSPHNHGRDFTSKCLFGKIKNIIYSYKEVPKSDWYLAEAYLPTTNNLLDITYDKKEPSMIYENIEPIIDSEEIQNKGDIINHYHKNIHDTEVLSKHACTRIINKSDFNEAPLIIQNKNIKRVSPYENRGLSEDNWETINKILKEQNDEI